MVMEAALCKEALPTSPAVLKHHTANLPKLGKLKSGLYASTLEKFLNLFKAAQPHFCHTDHYRRTSLQALLVIETSGCGGHW